MRVNAVLCALGVSLGFAAPGRAQVEVPHEFASGQPARAADVNENFATLAEGINDNAAAIRNFAGPATAGARPRSIAVVAASGGHYTDPLTAVANIAEGDAWCRKPADDPARHPCVISIAPGVYELASTLIVPEYVSVVGYGPSSTLLTARPGVSVAVQLGTARMPPVLGVVLRDLTIQNQFGGGGRSVAVVAIQEAGVEVYNVRATASGASDNIGVRFVGTRSAGDGYVATPDRFKMLEAAAAGGDTSVGFQLVGGGGAVIEQCSISAAGAGRNVGVDNDSVLRMSDCLVTAAGGHTAIALSAVGPETYRTAITYLSDTQLNAQDGSTSSIGYFSERSSGVFWDGVDAKASGPGENTGISLTIGPAFGEGYLEDVTAEASYGTVSVGMYNTGGHHDPFSLRAVNSTFRGIGGVGYGLQFGSGTEGIRLSVERSFVMGASAAMFTDQPFTRWEDVSGPPLAIRIVDTELQGPLNLNDHFVLCVAVRNFVDFYADTCPPGGDYTPYPY